MRNFVCENKKKKNKEMMIIKKNGELNESRLKKAYVV